ncbi:hypothetical protein DERP_007831 [Dermatophagoides pteronyssinus]|uniref:Uncharacterized protein n=1 Tax=Dermatophagoides pteronyssinus TaxID=6956 RepID=A0ABQ8ITG4_DERPT|nr:hypothetical protein DERP_007831 [Dermatophagoides pteronyssinus]
MSTIMDYVNQRSSSTTNTTNNNNSHNESMVVNCRKCRRYDRELNKVKDIAISLQHSVQILENIKPSPIGYSIVDSQNVATLTNNNGLPRNSRKRNKPFDSFKNGIENFHNESPSFGTEH